MSSGCRNQFGSLANSAKTLNKSNLYFTLHEPALDWR
jgi:hypothetical protein